AHPVKVSFPIVKDVAKSWLTGKYAEKKTDLNPLPVTRVEHIAVDPATEHGVRVAIDNNIGRIETSFDGYYGAVVTYTGTYTVAGVTLPFGQTVTRINNNKFTSEATLDLGAGPQVFGQLTCTK